jgi:tRNA(adenine34) deaminase
VGLRRRCGHEDPDEDRCREDPTHVVDTRAMERDEVLMRMALEEAAVALEHGDVPVGAVLVRGDDVIARAHNTRELLNDATGHAEISALRLGAERTGDWRLTEHELFVTLEPCPMCAGAAVAYRLNRLVFGAWNTQAGAAGSLYNVPEDPRLTHRISVVRGVLAEECTKQLEGFFSELRL